jgi:hypothetical protein
LAGAIRKSEAQRQALEKARDQVMSLDPEAVLWALNPDHHTSFRNGYAAARYAARDILNGMILDLLDGL